jgi:peptide/nickel transport system substrate-binding protein
MKRPALALILGAFMLLAACSTGGGSASVAATPKAGGTLKVAIESELRTLDPLKSSQRVERQVYYNIYDSLVTIDSSLKIKPGLATSWTYTDPTTLQFVLRQGVKFHDGTDFNADAVKFNIDRILTAASSPRKSELASVKSVEVKDPSTIVFHLKKQDAALLAQLVDRAGMILSPAAIQKGGVDFGLNPIGAGTGPFTFVEWKRDDHLTLKKNTSYWVAGRPYLDQVIYRPITDSNAALAALRTGDIDVAGTNAIADKDIAGIKSDSSLIYKDIPGLSFEGFEVNSGAGIFADKAKRQAVALALDRAQILKNVFFDLHPLSRGPIPPTSWAFDPSERIYIAADISKAKSMATGFSFALKTPNTPGSIQEATLIKDQLSKAGITVTIQTEEFGQILTEAAAHKFEAALVSWSGRIDPDGNMYGWFHTGGGFNDGQYSNAQVDSLLDQARVASDQAARKPLYDQAQQILVEDGAYLFIGHGPAQEIASAKVHNFPLIADAIDRFGEVWKG